MTCRVLGDAVEGGHGAVVEERHRRSQGRRRRLVVAGDDAAQLPRPDARYRARPHACTHTHRSGGTLVWSAQQPKPTASSRPAVVSDVGEEETDHGWRRPRRCRCCHGGVRRRQRRCRQDGGRGSRAPPALWTAWLGS